VYRTYKAGSYKHYNKRQHLKLFAGHKIRFGTYGEPVLIPVSIVRDIISVAKSHTGYTHMWNSGYGKPYRGLFQASVDTPSEAINAINAGWKYFRVLPIGQACNNDELLCLNESRGVQCVDCMLCNGSKRNIAITAHGVNAHKIE
jgi:hypothetical protein